MSVFNLLKSFSVCEQDMDDAYVGILINGVKWSEDKTFAIFGISPPPYDPNAHPSISDPSLTVKFNETIEINFVDFVLSVDTSDSWDDLDVLILLRNVDLTPFTDESGNPVAVEAIPVINGRADFPDNFPYQTLFNIIFVQASGDLIVNIRFRGCIHPG